MSSPLDTISKTPWLLAIPLLAASAVVVILTLNGEINAEIITKLLLSGGIGAGGGVLWRLLKGGKRKTLPPPADEDKPNKATEGANS